VGAATDRGDADAIELLARAGAPLGEAPALLIDVFNLECIILGSVYVRSRRWLEPAMCRAVEMNALPESLSACRIVPIELDEQGWQTRARLQLCSTAPPAVIPPLIPLHT
jgi:glucokinase